MGFWWCCCVDPCPIPETNLRVDGWYLVAPPIPPTRVDMPSIDLTFYPDFFGTGDHAWRSGCLPRADRPINTWYIGATYFAFDLANANKGHGLSDANRLAGACCYWTMDGFTASGCDCADHISAAQTHQGSAGGAGGNAFRTCSNDGNTWSLVSKTLSPFEEVWNSGSDYIRIYVP